LTGGGSGGHITPLLSLAQELKRLSPNCKLVYIGLKGDKLDGLEAKYKNFDQIYYIRSGKFRRYHGESFWKHLVDIRTLYLNACDIYRLISGIMNARKILKKIKPDVIFSKGGFVGVPVGIAGHRQHIPIVTHDSDSVAGLANKIVGRWATIHATGMPASYYNYPKNSIRYVGIPISDQIKPVDDTLNKQYREELNIPMDATVLLSAGGGLGSKLVNDLVASIAPRLLKANPVLQIIQIVGQQHLEDIEKQYQRLLNESELKRIKAIGFSPDFYKYSGLADLIIARAGATTLAEFATQKKACIIIPSPFLAGGHQLENARQLQKTGAAVVLDNDVSANDLFKIVNDLLDDRPKRSELANKLATTARTNAAKRLAQILLKIPQQKENYSS
jgi:UDP-N-acetylglucosamine--N-acetylmuramyl-(pentapeptide) pyrophosphoryl-undecaprenol N-acetylglucosamine transferase